MFKTILVPVDDTEVSVTAVKTASELAGQLGSSLLLVHCLEPLPTYTGNVAVYLPEGELDRAAAAYGQSVLDKYAESLPKGDHKTLLHRGDKKAWREILDVAVHHHADVIVMGTHGREGLSHALLGSVAERVARHADVPVMLVR